MFHIWWPATAILAFLMIFTVMMILMYGDKICHRVRYQTEAMITRMPRNSGGSGRPNAAREEQYRQPPPVITTISQPQYLPQEYQHQYQERGVGIEMHQPQQQKTYSREVEV